jgi:predicted enzyme related to lactoylglutathione lyase
MPRNLIVIQYVRDMERAVAFYRDGIGLEVAQHTPGWSMLVCGDAHLALHILGPRDTETAVPFAGVNFEIDDLDAAVERAVAKGARLVEIREPTSFVRVRLGVLIDPDGNGFELRQPV